MLSGVCIGTNNIASATVFYDKVLATIGMKRLVTEEHELGYADANGKVTVFIVNPYNEQPATFGNGTQVMFYADDEAGVKAFYDTALANGGTDEGVPGPRNYSANYYGAYVRDADGNKLHVAVKRG